MKRLFNQRGQNTLEYAVLIACIVGALIAMQVYMSRGVKGKLRDSTTQIGEQYSAGHTTSKRITYEDESKTLERFGVDEEGGELEGVSYTKIVDPAERTSTTDSGPGGDPDAVEEFTPMLDQEQLFEGSGPLF